MIVMIGIRVRICSIVCIVLIVSTVLNDIVSMIAIRVNIASAAIVVTLVLVVIVVMLVIRVRVVVIAIVVIIVSVVMTVMIVIIGDYCYGLFSCSCWYYCHSCFL